jgi:hypothetical protein
MTDNLDKKKPKGLKARFKHLTSRSKSPGNSSTDGAGKETPPPAKTESPSLPKATATKNVDKQTNLDIPAKIEDKRSRRQEADDELKAAAEALTNAMSKVSQTVQIPETLTLENVDHIDDVEGTAKEIAKAIDKFIEDRQLKLSSGSKAVWKTCLKRWYMAAFPYISPCLDTASVIHPSFFASMY